MSNATKPVLLPQPYGDLQNTIDGLQREILKPIEDEAPKKTTFDTDHYTITNDTTSRTFNADTCTTAELADVVATLIKDLAG